MFYKAKKKLATYLGIQLEIELVYFLLIAHYMMVMILMTKRVRMMIMESCEQMLMINTS